MEQSPPGPAAPRVYGTVVGRFTRPDIAESSALVASKAQPGVYWTLNDSGGTPVLYAVDLNGRDLGAWTVKGASNEDWESLASGPCQPAGQEHCLYIGDTGDNRESRDAYAVYRVPEPRVPAAAVPGQLFETADATRLVYTYEDGPHDSEAMYLPVEGNSIWFITKGRSKGIQLYQLPASAWQSGKGVARKVQGLLPNPRGKSQDLITDAGLSWDGKALAVRSNRTLYVFAVDADSGRPHLGTAPTVCDLSALKEPKGEGVTWSPPDKGAGQVLATEGDAGQISYIECPLPVEGRQSGR